MNVEGQLRGLGRPCPSESYANVSKNRKAGCRNAGKKNRRSGSLKVQSLDRRANGSLVERANFWALDSVIEIPSGPRKARPTVSSLGSQQTLSQGPLLFSFLASSSNLTIQNNIRMHYTYFGFPLPQIKYNRNHLPFPRSINLTSVNSSNQQAIYKFRPTLLTIYHSICTL